MADNVLEINDLSVNVKEGGKRVSILDSVSLSVPSLSIAALVGGSGSGKTTTGLAVLRLLSSGLTVSAGQIRFQEKNLLDIPTEQMRRVRGGQISMIFQEPLNAFNPVFSIGYQIDEVLKFHTDLNKTKRGERTLQLLDQVGLPDPKQVVRSYPHQLSGGMRQRAMIAQAIAADPKLIIADEPTSNLDVTLQARIIELFKRLKDELNLSILLITHDLGMVEHVADQVTVMTDGRIVESGHTTALVDKPKHEYTKRLIKAFKV